MGRWKPPPPASSPYITQAGFDALQAELKDLWVRRAEVVKALSAAAAEGDRSENAEYIYRKKELGGLDYRIRYLQKRLPNLNIVPPISADDDRHGQVFFGARVTLQRGEDREEAEYRIVGPDETDATGNAISIDSPLARAILKKSVGDEANLKLEHGREKILIKKIRYD
jgi:transcription elongation factor GreB